METKPRPDDLIRKLLEELEVRFFFTLLGVSLFSPFSVSFLRGGARGVVFETMRDTKTCQHSYYSYCFFLSFFLSNATRWSQKYQGPAGCL